MAPLSTSARPTQRVAHSFELSCSSSIALISGPRSRVATTGPRAVIPWLHDVAGWLGREGLWCNPERVRDALVEGMPLLLVLLDLLRDHLNKLLKLLELCGNELQQLLEIKQLLLLEGLHLLQLLRYDLQQLQQLLWRLAQADARLRIGRLARVWRSAPRCWKVGIRSRRTDTKRRSGKWTHQTSSVLICRISPLADSPGLCCDA
jgi:hypothetical protein